MRLNDKNKRILLIVLAAVAGYIWWGNLGLFYESDQFPETGVSSVADRTEIRASTLSIEYQQPRVNPFRPIDLISDKPKANPKPQPAAKIELRRLSEFYYLVGFVGSEKQDHIILAGGDRSSTILGIGDTLMGWKLAALRDNAAIFSREKRQDTLRITNGLQ